MGAFVPGRSLTVVVVASAALIAGCAAQTELDKKTATASVKMTDIQNALELVGDGQKRYEAEQVGRNGYEYCGLSANAANRGELRRAVELATMALDLGRKSGNADLVSQAARDLAVALGFAGKLTASNAVARLACSTPTW